MDASPVDWVWRITGDPNTFIRPTWIAVDGQSNLYVVDAANHRIQKFATDKQGNIYVVSVVGENVQKFRRR